MQCNKQIERDENVKQHDETLETVPVDKCIVSSSSSYSSVSRPVLLLLPNLHMSQRYSHRHISVPTRSLAKPSRNG
jgi:hypothetical protein